MADTETKEKESPKQARLLSPSANASLVVYNKIDITINIGSKESKPTA